MNYHDFNKLSNSPARTRRTTITNGDCGNNLPQIIERVTTSTFNNDNINNSIGREICHIPSENVMKRVFERLMKSNMLERIPELRGKATAYRKRNTQLELPINQETLPFYDDPVEN